MTVRHVRQDDPRGCAVASLAMVVGSSYAEVKAELPNECHLSGMSFMRTDQYLADKGYAVRRFFRHDVTAGTERPTWPVEPFADVHMCEVNAGAGAHFVVMLKDGTVLDPATDQPRRLSDYKEVNHIAGVYPLPLRQV